MDSDSFNDRLDRRALVFMKTLSGHTDDMYLSREWSRSDGFVSFPCCGRNVSCSFSNLVGEICRPVIYDHNQPSINVEEVAPNSVMATFIYFLEAQHADRDCEGTVHADLPFILGTRRVKKKTHILPTAHLARLLVSTTVNGPGGIGGFVLTNASSIMLMGRGSLPDWRRPAAPSPATM